MGVAASDIHAVVSDSMVDTADSHNDERQALMRTSTGSIYGRAMPQLSEHLFMHSAGFPSNGSAIKRAGDVPLVRCCSGLSYVVA